MIAHIFVYKTYLILTMKCKVTYFQKQHSSMQKNRHIHNTMQFIYMQSKSIRLSLLLEIESPVVKTYVILFLKKVSSVDKQCQLADFFFERKY